jgi:hypothetical protein
MFDVRASPRCIFCLETDRPFTGVEHILPESLGNTELVLPRGIVCDSCNNGPLSAVDQTFLDFVPIALIRVTRGVPTKSGGFPTVKLGNATVRQTGPQDVRIWVDNPKSVTKTSDGFKANLLGRNGTPRYVAAVTRFFFKVALELMYADLGQEEVLAPKYNEVRRIARGGQYSGYLILGKKANPHGSVHFTYQPVAIQGGRYGMGRDRCLWRKDGD